MIIEIFHTRPMLVYHLPFRFIFIREHFTVFSGHFYV